jgi:hypothetical protein
VTQPSPITRRELNRAFLARQLLLEHAEMTTEQAIDHLIGMQAQMPNPPYIGLWTRLADFAFEDLAQLVRHRRVVRMALMRNTIHLVTTADAGRLRPLLQPMMDRSFASSIFAKELVGVDVAAVAVAGRVAVEEQPLTFAELGAVLSPRWPDRDRAALTQVVRAHVPLVQVPPRGIWGHRGQARHTSLDAWVGSSADAGASVDDLVLRYLAAFGPASVADVQAWSGLTRLGEVMDRLRPDLVPWRDEAGAELFDLPDAPRPGAEVPAPVRFIPEYDNLLLAHADRHRIVSDDDRQKMFSANGVVPGTVLVDGFVAAFWKIARTGDAATLTVRPSRPLSERHLASVRSEGRRLLAVAAATVPSADLVIDVG